MKKSWYKYFVYVSMLFLLVALYKADYLTIPRIFSVPLLVGSLLALFAGLLCDTMMWRAVLSENRFSVGIAECLASKGLSVFAKYIPGKVWVIVGPAAYIKEKRNYPLGKLSSIALNAQFVSLWVGLIFGAAGLFVVGGLHLWGSLILLLWLGLTVVVFTPFAHSAVERVARRLLKKEFSIPRLDVKATFVVMPWFVAFWALLSLGFYLLVDSLTSTNVALSAGLAFPLAVTLGIMAIVAPGGLGAREAILTGYLTLAGLSLKDAATISVAARLWFLAGEMFTFVAGVIANHSVEKLKS